VPWANETRLKVKAEQFSDFGKILFASIVQKGKNPILVRYTLHWAMGAKTFHF
jgi:hypothetical protein